MHIIGSAGLGGAERFFLRLTAALGQAGHEVVSVTKPRSELNPLIAQGVTQKYVSMRGRLDLLSRWRIRHLAYKYRPDIVQTYMGRATSLTTSLPSTTKHVARLGGYYRVNTYSHADHLVGNTRGICEYLVEGGRPPSEVSYIGNFVEPIGSVPEHTLTSLRRQLNLEQDSFVIISMGRLHHNKAFDTLLEAFALLVHSWKSPRKIYLVILGDGPEASNIRALRSNLELDDCVRMTGWVEQPEQYLQLADLFVCPSRHEPLGNVILEAWNAGLPVIAADAAGPVELIEPDVDGILFERDNSAALAQTLQSAANMAPSKRADLVMQGQQKLRREHDIESVLNAYLTLYEQLRVAS